MAIGQGEQQVEWDFNAGFGRASGGREGAMIPQALDTGCSFNCFAMSRSTNFWILPVEVFGSSANTTVRGHLKCGQVFAAEGDDLGFVSTVATVLQRDEGAGRLAPILVRPGHHRRVQHRRMAVEHVLDLDASRCSRRPR